MSRGTHAVLDYYLANATNEKCPEGQSSWCSFSRDKATVKSSYLLIKNPSSTNYCGSAENSF